MLSSFINERASKSNVPLGVRDKAQDPAAQRRENDAARRWNVGGIFWVYMWRHSSESPGTESGVRYIALIVGEWRAQREREREREKERL